MRRVIAAVLLSSCTAIADFPSERLDEATDALCGNGIDDDGDGLSDCQEWSCLGQPVCCNVPSVVLEESFAGPSCAAAACADENRDCAPDEAEWTRWGAPYPYLCEGALRIDKDFAGCYPVGILSRTTVTLEPGLRIEARVSGAPELAERLDLGLTLDSAVIDGAEPCATRAAVTTLASLVYADAPDGARFLVMLGDTPIAEHPTIDGEHDIAIEVTPEGTLGFVVDGSYVAITTDPLPADLTTAARVVVSGLGREARLEHLRVITGTQCEDPTAWTPASPSTPLEPDTADAWDEHQRSTPNARIDGDALHVVYSGCRATVSDACTPLTIALGEATALEDGPLERPDGGFVTSEELSHEGTHIVTFDMHVVEGTDAYYGPDGDYFDEFVGLYRVDLDEPDVSLGLLLEEPGGWDDRSMCCPTVADGPDGVRRLYYAGRTSGDDRWSIGLATSINGDTFFREGPVLGPGPEDSIYELGASQPWVLWDDVRLMYRMWFVATDELQRTSIGYAVSADGETWDVYDRAVVVPGAVGASSIGSPTVVSDRGRLRMWVDGVPLGGVAKTIYELENLGVAPP